MQCLIQRTYLDGKDIYKYIYIAAIYILTALKIIQLKAEKFQNIENRY